MAEPDFVYDPEDWEVTHEWSDRDMLVEDDYLTPGTFRPFATLTRGPEVFAARVVLTRDDEGDPDETEVRWFSSEADARAACGMPARDLFAAK